MGTRVVADVHERGCEVYRLLEQDRDVELETSALREGDYLIANRVLVERKSLPDFWASVRSRRLFRQAHRLKHRRDVVSLVVVELDQRGEHLVTAQGLGAQLALALSFGIPVLSVHSPAQLVWLLKQIAAHVDRQHTRAHVPVLRRYRNPYRDAQNLLGQLPGIGPAKASALIRHFGSIRKIFAASEAELAEVKKIGAKIAKRLSDFLDANDHGECERASDK